MLQYAKELLITCAIKYVKENRKLQLISLAKKNGYVSIAQRTGQWKKVETVRNAEYHSGSIGLGIHYIVCYEKACLHWF